MSSHSRRLRKPSLYVPEVEEPARYSQNWSSDPLKWQRQIPSYIWASLWWACCSYLHPRGQPKLWLGFIQPPSSAPPQPSGERPRVALLIHHVPPPYTQFINQPSGPPTHTNQPSKRIPVGRPWSITEKHYSFHPEGRSTNTDFHAIWQEQLFVIGRIR